LAGRGYSAGVVGGPVSDAVLPAAQLRGRRW